MRILNPDGQPRPNVGAGLRYLDFPLRVGKTWEHALDMASLSGPSYSYRNRFTVEAYELIKVPAGTFKAFRIRHDQENLSTRFRWSAVSWWSPEARWFVKVGAFRGQSVGAEGTGIDLALQSYSLK